MLYLKPTLLSILALGFVSGLPLALTGSTLIAWLAEEGINLTTIGLFAAVGIPYSIKFLWAPLVDQLPIPYLTKWLGKRRSWLLIVQLLLIISIITLGTINPLTAPWYTALFALCVSSLSATQDIIIDAYRIELLEESEQAAGAATVVFGYRLGMIASGAGALYLADQTSWSNTYLIMSSLVLIGTATMLLIGEPGKSQPLEKRTLRQWIQDSVIKPFSDITTHQHWIMILAFIILYKFGDAFAGTLSYAFYIDIGFSKTEIATIAKLFGLGATIIGGFIGGYIVKRYGLYNSLWLCGILQMLSNLMFVLQAHVGYDTNLLTATLAIENITGGMGTVAFVAYISNLCNLNYTATQYALLSAFASIGRTTLTTTSGFIAETLGWELFFSISVLTAIPGLYLLYKLPRDNNNPKQPA